MDQPATAAVLKLMRADRTNFAIARLEQLTGLKLEDVDHIVIGLKMEEADLPHLYVVVRTRSPYDEEKVREKLKAKRVNGLSGKRVYRITLEQTQPGGALWCAGDRTLVFALQPKDLAELPAKPSSGVDRFAPELQKHLTSPYLAVGTRAWIVGASSRWDEILGLLQLVGLPEADWQGLSQVRAFVGQIHFGPGFEAFLLAECADAAGALKFANYLAAKGLDSRHLGALAQQRPQAAAFFGELARSLRREPHGNHVILSLGATIESVRQALDTGSVQGRAVE
jgi:hypothetical protein